MGYRQKDFEDWVIETRDSLRSSLATDYGRIFRSEHAEAYAKGGKMVRGTLCALFYSIFQNEPVDIQSKDDKITLLRDGATGVEAFHSLSLLLDDIQDRDKLRRGAETLYAISLKAGGVEFKSKRDAMKKALENAFITYSACLDAVFHEVDERLTGREDIKECFRRRGAGAYAGQWLELMGTNSLAIQFPGDYIESVPRHHENMINSITTGYVYGLQRAIERFIDKKHMMGLDGYVQRRQVSFEKKYYDRLRYVPYYQLGEVKDKLTKELTRLEKTPEQIPGGEIPRVFEAGIAFAEKELDKAIEKYGSEQEMKDEWRQTLWDEGYGKKERHGKPVKYEDRIPKIIHSDLRRNLFRIFRQEIKKEGRLKALKKLEDIDLSIRNVADMIVNTERSYRRICRLKTGQLFALPVEVGGKVAGVKGNISRNIVAFGVNYGIAMQMHNDLKGFFKDISNGNHTYMVIKCLRGSKEFRDELFPRNAGLPVNRLTRREWREKRAKIHAHNESVKKRNIEMIRKSKLSEKEKKKLEKRARMRETKQLRNEKLTSAIEEKWMSDEDKKRMVDIVVNKRGESVWNEIKRNMKAAMNNYDRLKTEVANKEFYNVAREYILDSYGLGRFIKDYSAKELKDLMEIEEKLGKQKEER